MAEKEIKYHLNFLKHRKLIKEAREIRGERDAANLISDRIRKWYIKVEIKNNKWWDKVKNILEIEESGDIKILSYNYITREITVVKK